MEEKRKNISPIVEWIGNMADIISKYGVWKIISSILILCIGILLFSATLNPAIVLDRIDKYLTKRLIENRTFRRDNDPLIRAEISSTLHEIGAVRVSVFEFHNGKENAGSLGFYYADLTYEAVREGYPYVSKLCQNINLSLIQLPSLLYNNGYWYGTVEQLAKEDPHFAQLIKEGGSGWAYFMLLEGTTELGFLSVTTEQEPEKEDLAHLIKKIRKTGVKIAAKLDYKANR